MVRDVPPSSPQAPEHGPEAEELGYRLAQQQLAADLALFALRNHDVQALLQEASRVCAQGLASQYCKVMEYMPADDRLLVRAGVGWKPGVVGHAHTGADLDSPTGYAFRTGEPVISNHDAGEERFRTPALLAEHGIKRAINVVIRVGDEAFGVLEVDSPLENRFDEADLFFVGGCASLLGVAMERRRNEEELQRKETLLQQALERQELLRKEMNHRVKNSLSVVAGMLAMQAREIADPVLKQALTDARSRISTIASMHDRLWRLDEVHRVEMSEFLNELGDSLRDSAPGHEIVTDLAAVTLGTGQAIALGLLVNELVTNALKYAYPGGGGRIWLSLASGAGGELRLEVRDEGVGLPPDVAAGGASGYGRKLTSTLARQLDGRLNWEDAVPGTRCVLVFTPAP